MEKFERRMNLTLEYLVLIFAYGAIVASCCGYWWHLFWLTLVPLWALMHRGNYGKHRRSWMEWLLEFLLIVRVEPGRRRHVLRWSPTAWAAVLATGLAAGILEGLYRTWEFIKDELITVKN